MAAVIPSLLDDRPGDQALTDAVFENPRVKAKVEQYLAQRSSGDAKSESVSIDELWRQVEEKVRQGDE